MEYLVVGLGNPGKQYESTRHNAGFLVIDNVVYGEWGKEKAVSGLVVQEDVSGRVVTYLKPQVFMNRSGESVAKAIKKWNVPLENVIVIHDEYDLPIGDMKVSFGKGDAGHNGVKSVTHALESKDFVRVRIGVAPVGLRKKFSIAPRMQQVLKKLSKKDIEVIREHTSQVTTFINTFVEEGREKALSTFSV